MAIVVASTVGVRILPRASTSPHAATRAPVTAAAHALLTRLKIVFVEMPLSTPLDDDAADRLARAIEERRYGEIDAAAAAIRARSPYARWVPAAVGLAIEQMDATNAAYARMNMCDELREFVERIEMAWPLGAASRAPVQCVEARECGLMRRAAIEAAGGAANWARIREATEQRRRAELDLQLANAIAGGDHEGALAVCAQIRYESRGREMPASCLAEACRAKELAIADVLYKATDRPGHLWRTTDPEWIARDACHRAGVDFVDGRATAFGVHSPSSLVRVHPDAPEDHAEHLIAHDW